MEKINEGEAICVKITRSGSGRNWGIEKVERVNCQDTDLNIQKVPVHKSKESGKMYIIIDQASRHKTRVFEVLQNGDIKPFESEIIVNKAGTLERVDFFLDDNNRKEILDLSRKIKNSAKKSDSQGS